MTSPIFARAAEQWAAMRMDYADYLEAHIAAAVEATNGVLLNSRGRAGAVTEEQLFRASARVAAAYASEELLEFWRTHPRMTLAAFEVQWLEDQHAAPYSWADVDAA